MQKPIWFSLKTYLIITCKILRIISVRFLKSYQNHFSGSETLLLFITQNSQKQLLFFGQLNINLLIRRLGRHSHRRGWRYRSTLSAVVKFIWTNYLLFEKCTTTGTLQRKFKHIIVTPKRIRTYYYPRIINGSSLTVSFLVQYPHTEQYWKSLNVSFSSLELHFGHFFNNI